MKYRRVVLSLGIVWLSFLLPPLSAQESVAEGYDPSTVADGEVAEFINLQIPDATRSRDIPLRVYLSRLPDPRPMILFSHGLGGTNQGCDYLGKHWSGRGYLVGFLQHPGSDDSVWRDLPLRERMKAMRDAASLSNLIDRIADVRRALDQLQEWNATAAHPLHNRCDLARVGMSGHSFGAITTQAVSGQTFPLVRQRNTDPRIRAALAFSPSPPRQGSPAVAFGKVAIPWMLITGTRDDSFIGNWQAEDRKAVFHNLPDAIDRYQLVLDGATHSAFVDRPLPWDKGFWNPSHHRVIAALTTAFWDAHLGQNEAARHWLHGAGPRSLLSDKDDWQCLSKGEPGAKP